MTYEYRGLAVSWPPSEYYPAILKDEPNDMVSFSFPDFPDVAPVTAEAGLVNLALETVLLEAVRKREAANQLKPFPSSPASLTGGSVVLVHLPHIQALKQVEASDE